DVGHLGRRGDGDRGDGVPGGGRGVETLRLKRSRRGYEPDAAMDHETRGVPGRAPWAGAAASVRRPAVLLAGAIVLAVVLGIVLWLLLRGGEKPDRGQRVPAAAASITRLSALAGSVGHSVSGAVPR